MSIYLLAALAYLVVVGLMALVITPRIRDVAIIAVIGVGFVLLAPAECWLRQGLGEPGAAPDPGRSRCVTPAGVELTRDGQPRASTIAITVWLTTSTAGTAAALGATRRRSSRHPASPAPVDSSDT